MDKGYKIPLTATGIVREEMKRNFSECDPKFKKAYLRAFNRMLERRSDGEEWKTAEDVYNWWVSR